MTINVGDTVIYTEFNKSYRATVIELRDLESHLGTGREPMVHLGFFRVLPGLIGTQNQDQLAQFRLDVVHVSYMIDTYPGGRWKEVKRIESRSVN